MNVLTKTQKTLDKVLLPYGITSHHLRRVEVDTIIDSNKRKIKVNNNEYVVYRLVSSKSGYGDGKPIAARCYVNINYYYVYEKTDAKFAEVDERINSVIKEFLQDGRVRVANGKSDIYDIDNPYRGINIELLFFK